MSPCLLCCIMALAIAAEPEVPVVLPDPYGLGERLVLIDWLREQGVGLPAEGDLGAMRLLYRQTLAARDPGVAQLADEQERARQLRRQLVERFKVQPSATASLAELGSLREQLAREAAERIVAEAKKKEASHASAQTPGAGAAQPGAEQAMVVRLRAATVLVVVPQRGTGSGFFVDGSGLLITNAHVTGTATQAWVLWDAAVGRKAEPFAVVRRHPDADLVQLRPVRPGQHFPALDLAREASLGQAVMTLGFPYAGAMPETLGTSPADLVLSRGVLSAVRKDKDGIPRWLQTDARIAPGNSGGPLVDAASGTVLGVVTMAMNPDAGGEALFLAIPATVVTSWVAGR